MKKVLLLIFLVLVLLCNIVVAKEKMGDNITVIHHNPDATFQVKKDWQAFKIQNDTLKVKKYMAGNVKKGEQKEFTDVFKNVIYAGKINGDREGNSLEVYVLYGSGVMKIAGKKYKYNLQSSQEPVFIEAYSNNGTQWIKEINIIRETYKPFAPALSGKNIGGKDDFKFYLDIPQVKQIMVRGVPYTNKIDGNFFMETKNYSFKDANSKAQTFELTEFLGVGQLPFGSANAKTSLAATCFFKQYPGITINTYLVDGNVYHIGNWYDKEKKAQELFLICMQLDDTWGIMYVLPEKMKAKGLEMAENSLLTFRAVKK